MKESFICPHCKNITGWREVIPVHGHYAEHYDENGEFEVGAYSDSMNYYEKSRKYECTRCNRNIKEFIELIEEYPDDAFIMCFGNGRGFCISDVEFFEFENQICIVVD